MDKRPTFVVTGKVRLTFVHLFTPYANPNGGEAKYSTTILVPKTDFTTKQKIDQAIQMASQAGVSKTWGGVMPPLTHLSIPVHDGDGLRPSDGLPFGPECKGHWVFTASAKQKPEVVDAKLDPIMNQSDVYSGMYAQVSINFFPYANSGKKGIGCGLGNVMKVEDGEPLGGRTTAADDFGRLAPQVQQIPQVQQYQQPFYQPETLAQIDPITGMPVIGTIMGL